MEDILRRYVGRCGITHTEAAQCIAWGTKGRRERRLRSFLEGKGKMRADELLAFMAHLGPDFTNEILETVGYTGVIKMKGQVSDIEVLHRMNEAQQAYMAFFEAPGNGNEHRVRRAASRVVNRLRQFLHSPIWHRLRKA